MKILILADFRRDSPFYLLNNPRLLSKGFMRNGHDVLEFSYRDTLLSLSPIRSKRWARKLAKNKLEQADLFLLLNHVWAVLGQA